QGLLMRYPWPGNVRELHNEMKRAAALTAGRRVEISHLSERILGSEAGRSYTHQKKAAQADESLPLNLRKAESVLIERALRQAGGQKTKAAELLGITREGLRKKLQRITGEAL
ncbi:MAG: sigma-54-dependent Fis family transcriptional regulator, partial [Mailhella sp.]|nr:sigma-54-dependent Fis family transcriptional regulator [Mailhella sp.]